MGKEAVVDIYGGILLSHQKDEILSFAMTQMELEYNAERNKSEKDKYRMISLIVEVKKQMSKGEKRERERQTKQQTLNYREQTDGYRRGGGRGDGETGDGV